MCTEKGILKKHGYGLVHGDQLKDKWADDGQSDNLELITQDGTTLLSSGGTAVSEVERTLKSLNGYHEDILEALRNAASHRGTGTGNTPVGSGSLSEEMLRKTLQDCANSQLNYPTETYKRASSSKNSSRENICDPIQTHPSLMVDGSNLIGGHSGSILHHHRSQHQLHQPMMQTQMQASLADEEESGPATGPLRIRNLEDLIRQLEHHSSRHMSPNDSEDIRLSESEAGDRHYRLDSSAACSESSQGLVNNCFYKML